MVQSLLEKIHSKKARIGVIGLGYVGLPLAILAAERGYKVTGFLRSEAKVRELTSYKTNVDTISQKTLKGVIDLQQLVFSVLSSSSLSEQDILIICVPTPVTHEKTPDLTAMRSVAKHLSEAKLSGTLVINESTVAPGTTHDLFGHLDVFLACSPERVDPGNTDKNVSSIAKVVGGKDKESISLAQAFYESILEAQVVTVSSLEAAEMTKMLENTYRAVNIALINEFALLADILNIDIAEVISAAKTKWSFQAHYPGIGVGGHCIPVDPYYIVELAKRQRLDMPVVARSLAQNEDMPQVFIEKFLSVYKKSMNVVVYGLSYKKNVKDLRESPAIVFCTLLASKGIPFSVYDPLCSKEEIMGLGFTPGTKKTADIFIVATDHDDLKTDYKAFVNKKTIVIDGRNYFREKVGKLVIGIGRRLE